MKTNKMGFNKCDWETPDGFPDISENQVHIWRVNTIDFSNLTQEFENLLNETEKKRANQFKYEKSKERFIICRGALRFMLSRYLKENPASIGIFENQGGKPEITDKYHQHALEFNISHSNEICLKAFSQNLELGIDVEAIRPFGELEDMAKSFLSKRELAAFNSCTPEKKPIKFFDLWSAKEALLKAIGCGLMIQPNQIEIEEILEKKKFSVQYRSNVIEMPHIEMIALNGLGGYAAWLVVAGEVGKISKFRFSKQLVSI